LATPLVLPTPSRVEQPKPSARERAFGFGLITVLTAFALAIHGYHPSAEDGGIYLASTKRVLDPHLYPYWSEFVTEHLRFSLFAPMVAALVHATHLQLMTVWLLLYIASFWLTLYAGWQLASRCYASSEARCGAVTLLATWLTLPVAGTSLMLMDPYLTARSISTPCILLSLAALLDLFSEEPANRPRVAALVLAPLAIAALVHPLMAAYGLANAVLLACTLSKSSKVRIATTAALSLFAILFAFTLYKVSPVEPEPYRSIALTRTYWFLTSWQTYEQFGLAAPIAILTAVALQPHKQASKAARTLAFAVALAGTISCTIALLFACPNAQTFLLARLQPLRIFQIVYTVMILAVGAFLGERLLQRKPIRWLSLFTVLGGIMFFAERQTFPNSSHFESPNNSPTNPWTRAFQWISASTPVDALFALDAHYISLTGEDAQTFRATAQRSALPDYSKDGGVASITPGLTTAWLTGQTAQIGLNTATDATRITTLQPLGVTWIVLPGTSQTGLTCPYSEQAVKVCHLPQQ
jgi:hypothetical protein